MKIYSQISAKYSSESFRTKKKYKLAIKLNKTHLIQQNIFWLQVSVNDANAM